MCDQSTVSVKTRRADGLLAVALLAIVAGFAAAPSAALAGPRNLDDAEFIRGLKNRGMKELIVYYIEKNPPKDPIERLEVLIEQKKLILDDDGETPEKRRAAGMEVIDLYRQIIKQAPAVHWKQIVWKVEYVTYLFEVVMPRLELNAAEFVEFGVPTKEQRDAFNEYAEDAYNMMESAGDQWFMMPLLLPKKPNFEEDFVNNGRWRMLKDDFGAIRLPFYRSWARYYFSMTPKGQARGGKMTEELEEAVRFLDAVGRQEIAPSVVTKLRSVQGRIQLALGDHVAADQALKKALGAIANGTSQMDVLIVKLAMVQTIAAPGLAKAEAPKAAPKKDDKAAPKKDDKAAPKKDDKAGDKKADDKKPAAKDAGKKAPDGKPGAAGKPADAKADDKKDDDKKDDKKKAAPPAKKLLSPEVIQAVAALQAIKRDPLVKNSPMLLVLAYDLQFRLTDDYDAYVDLFNDPVLANNPGLRAAVENHVYARLADIKVDDLATVPPLVVMAHVEHNMLNPGMELHNQAMEEKSESKKKDLIAQTQKKLAPAIKELTRLLERDTLSEGMRGKALFKLGIAYFNAWDFYHAGETLLEIADKHPNDPNAQLSMQNAIALIMQVYKENTDKQYVKDKVEEALKVLLEKYPQLPEAKTHQYTWAAMLRQEKDYDKAIEAYKKIGPSHQFYADSQYEMLICQHALWLAEPADSDNKSKLAGNLLPQADQAMKVIKDAMQNAPADRKSKLQHMLGDTMLIKAEGLGEGLNQIALARALVKDFDAEFSEFRDLINAKRRLSINLHIRAGDVDKALDEIRKFIAQFPNEGGPLIRGVLESINRMAADKEVLPGQKSEAQKLYDIGVEIAQMLLDWAKRQEQFKSPAALLPFQMIVADQFIAAKKYEDAMKLLEELFKTNPKNMDIMFGLAKAYFAQGIYEAKDPANPLSGVLPICNKIINNVQPDPKSGKYPETYWEVWSLRLQSVDKQLEQMKTDSANVQKAKDRGVAEIYMMVRKLELADQKLGNGAAAPILTRLKIKWQK
ncbi:MAG: tetratricopeptide repeat protein [Phycisphaera sp.]|nr:tetratricopeptide repeat protein [Phycisphaera sp.]